MTRLYDETAEDLLRFIARRTVDPQIAFDLVGETFAEAIASRASFHGDSLEDGRRWLFGIARNLMNNYFRRGQLEQRAMERAQMDGHLLSADDFARIDEIAQLEESREVVREALARLKPEYRVAVEARILQQRGYAEIASGLGVSEQVVRTRVSRGLKHLRRDIERTAQRGEGNDA